MYVCVCVFMCRLEPLCLSAVEQDDAAYSVDSKANGDEKEEDQGIKDQKQERD